MVFPPASYGLKLQHKNIRQRPHTGTSGGLRSGPGHRPGEVILAKAYHDYRRLSKEYVPGRAEAESPRGETQSRNLVIPRRLRRTIQLPVLASHQDSPATTSLRILVPSRHVWGRRGSHLSPTDPIWDRALQRHHRNAHYLRPRQAGSGRALVSSNGLLLPAPLHCYHVRLEKGQYRVKRDR
jgi:hypothetical protein